MLSGVLGTVAVSAPAGASENIPPEEPPAETSGELPVLNEFLAAGATEVSQATERHAARTDMNRVHADAVQQAEQTAAAYRAEREQAAAEARAAEEAAQQAAEERAAEEAAASRDSERSEPTDASDPAEGAPDAGTMAAEGGSGGAVINYMRSQLGAGYSLGADGPDAWDCSSLTQAAYGEAGISLPRTAEEQSAMGTEVGLDEAQPGDLLYWGGRGSAYHVAVYVGDGRFIGAQNSSTGVVERDLDWDMPTGAVRLS